MRRATASARAATRLLGVALTVALTVTGCAGSGLLPTGVIQPGIVPAAGKAGTQTVTREFAFEERRVTLQVPIDLDVYAGAASAQKSAIFIGGKAPSDWVPDYYRAFVEEQHQERFYASLTAALHEVRDREGLDAARYVELVTSMAQQLEYRTDPANLAPKFPIETFGDGYGDCDDKALLAAALLARDGYDVAILVFEAEKHVALGVRAPGLDYKGTGLAYVEVTRPSLVGVPAQQLAGGRLLSSQPEVIRIGTGALAYTAGGQITAITDRLAKVVADEKRMKARIDAEKSALAADKAALDAESASLSGIGDPAARSAAIARYNQAVTRYNARAAASNELVAEFNRLVETEKYVAEHQYARPQVYARLKALGP